MARSTFSYCMPLLFDTEGGFNHRSKKADPGGATNLGITQRTLSVYRKRPVTIEEVRQLTYEEATEIYRLQYWNAVRGDELPYGVDLAMFDFAVNSGPGRAIKELQRILGVTADGVMGIHTMDAVQVSERHALAMELCVRRLAFMKRLKNWPYNKNGWTARVRKIQKLSGELAKLGAVPGGPVPADDEIPPTPKAKPDEIKPTSTCFSPEALAAASGILGHLGSMMVDNLPLQIAFAVVVVGSVGFGGFYLFKRMQKAEI